MTSAVLGAAMGTISAAIIYWFATLIDPTSKPRSILLRAAVAVLMPWPFVLGLFAAPIPDDGQNAYFAGWLFVTGYAGWRWLVRPRLRRSGEGL